MKKITIVLFTILALLFSMLPISSAAAKKDTGNVFLYVRNRTGGLVHIVLTNANGKKLVFDYPVGMAKETMPQGKYGYYIITPCQKLSGDINLNVTKQLFFACDQGVDSETLAEVTVQPAPWTPTDGCVYSAIGGGMWTCHGFFNYIRDR